MLHNRKGEIEGERVHTCMHVYTMHIFMCINWLNILCSELHDHEIKVPAEMIETLMILHSYLLVKVRPVHLYTCTYSGICMCMLCCIRKSQFFYCVVSCFIC